MLELDEELRILYAFVPELSVKTCGKNMAVPAKDKMEAWT
jgi:hypothetical protein